MEQCPTWGRGLLGLVTLSSQLAKACHQGARKVLAQSQGADGYTRAGCRHPSASRFKTHSSGLGSRISNPF